MISWEQEITDLQNEIQSVIKVYSQEDNITTMSLGSLLRQLKDIRRKLSIENYKLIFIGEKGVGKTTMLTHLFNLFLLLDEIDNKDKGLQELLSTASGGTTLCEVEVVKSDTNFIKIVPYMPDELRELIKDYCLYIWEKTHKKIQDKSKNKLSLPTELVRGIKNLCGLRNRREDKKTIRPSEDLAKTYADDSFDLFYETVVGRAYLERRTCEVLEIKGNSIEERKKDIIKKFSQLNLVNKVEFSIPKKIILNLNNDIFSIDENLHIKGLIDTRGIDSNGIQTRQDLDEYIRNHEEAICIFVDDYKAVVKSDIKEYITKSMDLGIRDIKDKIVLMVKYEEGEPEDTMKEDGKVESKEEGIEVKLEESILVDLEGVDFEQENILFYNACNKLIKKGDKWYIPNERYPKIISEIENYRQHMVQQIENVILRKEENLKYEITEIKKHFNIIKHGITMDAKIKEKLDYIHTQVDVAMQNSVGFSKKLSNDFLEKYISYFNKEHHMRILATNNRFGYYDSGNFNIYYLANMCIENMLIDSTKEYKDKLQGVFEAIAIDMEENFKSILHTLEKEISNYYYKFITETEKHIQLLTEKALAPQNNSNLFWQQVKARWGQGTGYKSDVIDMYHYTLQKSQVYNGYLSAIKEIVQITWEKEFIQPIKKFMK